MPAVPPHLGDDPVAARTTWEPLVGGGANFKTRRLVTVDASRVEFPASVGARLFAAVFGAFGLGALALGFEARDWPPALCGLAFTGIGVALWRFGTTPVVFDRRQGAPSRHPVIPLSRPPVIPLSRYPVLPFPRPPVIPSSPP